MGVLAGEVFWAKWLGREIARYALLAEIWISAGNVHFGGKKFE